MATTKFNITQAHRITGKSPSTIRKHIKQGELSVEKGPSGVPMIDGAELTRVYGVSEGDFAKASPHANTGAIDSVRGGQPGGQLLASVQQRLDTEIRERKRERERLEQQVDDLHGVLKRTQEGHERAMRLIEDGSQRAGDWQGPLKALKQQVAAHEREHRELKESAKRRIKQLQQTLDAERSKSLLQELFG
ncbi:MAG: hypothetical protein AAGJ46_01795 [Planctomycetota bacterium]